MKFSLRFLILVTALLAAILGFFASRYSPTTIKLGMPRSKVESLMQYVGAEDITSGMSTYKVVIPTADGEISKQAVADLDTGLMWSVARLNVSIETRYENGKLVELSIWDWRGRRLNGYHRTIEYDSVSSIAIPFLHHSWKSNVLETHNPGVNPPVHSSK